ncbi:hypothetical protein BDV95DRAFT_37284 [Massariosphaeria phaeospora]|uniref:Uncharacterized protein n=1 Tax=Massariosphaeria phaeospora TaxID=100035 RepID=A0A7C8M6P0_9PLEO|nr:hypothetical protein BDV95DRAFT_37284 [Massariosphaeria phaeospora]
MDRRTTIIDDASALKMGAPVQRGKNKTTQEKATKRTTQPKPTPNGTAMQNRPTKPKPKPKPKGNVGPMIYEADGLRIPLFHDPSGNRKRVPRGAKSLANKFNVEALLNVVREYAGEAKVQEMKDLRKMEIAEWIEAMEKKAMGPRLIDHANGNHGAGSNRQAAAESKASKRKYGDAEDELPTAPHHTPKKQKTHQSPEPARKMVSSPPPPPRNAPSPPTIDVASEEEESSDEEELEGESPNNLAEVLFEEFSARPDEPAPRRQTPAPATVPTVAPTPAQLQPTSQGPLPNQLGLDPRSAFTATQIAHLPEENEHQILTAHMPDKIPLQIFHSGPPTLTFFRTCIPYNACSQRRARSPAPFLKPGRHGPRGQFLNDPDLLTGKGHQVEPADQRKYDEAQKFQQGLWKTYPEYQRTGDRSLLKPEELKRLGEVVAYERLWRKKYPGMNGGEWQCGCLVPQDEDEVVSEEE